MIDRLTPLPEWARQVGLDYQRAYRLARKGEIRTTRLGKRIYVLDDGIVEKGEGLERERPHGLRGGRS